MIFPNIIPRAISLELRSSSGEYFGWIEDGGGLVKLCHFSLAFATDVDGRLPKVDVMSSYRRLFLRRLHFFFLVIAFKTTKVSIIRC